MKLKAPFPWFGGKSRCAHLVWDRFGDVKNYVEPFAGSLAVLLGRPYPAKIETVNDLDCYIANFWRAVLHEPDSVAYWADYPVNETDLHARHRWLVAQTEFRERMQADPDYYDAKIAGWWLWGICMWIGSGWCQKPEWKGRAKTTGKPIGIHVPNKRPGRDRDGRGVHKRRPDLTCNHGIYTSQQLPAISGNSGASGQGVLASGCQISALQWMLLLQDRLRHVRVCCGDWSRLLGPSVTTIIGITGIFFDPPYSKSSGRKADIYNEDSLTVADDVRQWCIENGDNQKLRIALCGYEGEHNELEEKGWSKLAWESVGGYGKDKKGKKLERIWFSPHCLVNQELFYQ